MRGWRVALVLIVALVACAGCGGGSPSPDRPGDAEHGKTIFADKCATCHGERGRGGTAPALAGASLSVSTVKDRIDNGASGMPVGLVGGQDEQDVLAYVKTILRSDGST